MPDVPFLQDVKVTLSWNTREKNTLTLTETGDLQLVEGGEKLAEQLMRAIVNDEAKTRELLNMPNLSTRRVFALFNIILRNFRQTQVDEVKKADPDFSGYKIYRRAYGSDESYSLVSQEPIIYTYNDSGLNNGTVYEYGLTKVYRNIFETTFVEKFSIFPTRFSNRQQILIGRSSAAIAGDSLITFYVDYNKRFKGSELLDKILSIDVQRDETDPRKYVVNVIVRTLQGTEISASTKQVTL